MEISRKEGFLGKVKEKAGEVSQLAQFALAVAIVATQDWLRHRREKKVTMRGI